MENYVYKKIGEVTLSLNVFKPANWRKNDQRPAIVFFFGGGWVRGNVEQFRRQSEYLAGKGLVAITADYRVMDRHHTSPVESVEDGKSAIAWVREHAEDLGVDPERIVASGGSAGGHVAACTAVVPGFTKDGEEAKSKPNLLVLFNPAVDLTAKGFQNKATALLTDRQKEALSPLCHVKSGLPDTIIFHGNNDRIIPVSHVEQFSKQMSDASNACKLVIHDGEDHGFFNQSPGYEQTLQQLERFLQEHDYIK